MRARTLLMIPVAAGVLAGGAATADAALFERAESLDAANAKGLAVGDFNGDGRPDLAAAGSTNALVWFGKPGGGFAEKAPIPMEEAPRDVSVGDFNRDGIDDLVVTSEHYVVTRLGDGAGIFEGGISSKHTRTVRGLTVADFDADGIDDLAFTLQDTGSSVLAVRRGLGDGKFSAAAERPGDASQLVAGDFTGDGQQDLAHGTYYGKAPGLLVGKPFVEFADGPAIDLGGTANFPRTWAAGDVNGDAKLDLAVKLGKTIVAVRLGKGDGSFAGGIDVPIGPELGGSVALADVDGDGDQDLLAADPDAGLLHVRTGDGTGKSFAQTPPVEIGSGAADPVLADFDGDGTLDVAVAAGKINSIEIRYGATPSPLAGNLLVNGGFEGPGASGRGADLPAIPGWQRTGGMTFRRYGTASQAYVPTRLHAAQFGTGSNFAWGGNSAGTNGITDAFQTVDVSGSAASIDAGKATVRLSAWLGGSLFYGDRMGVKAEFLDAAGGVLATLPIDPVGAAERVNRSTLVPRAASSAVPPSTRRIKVTVTSIDDDKTLSGAMADNVKLTLDAPAVPGTGNDGGTGGDVVEQPSAGDGPDALAPRFGARPGVTLALLGRRGAKVRIRVRNANAFPVVARLRAPRVKARTATVAAQGAKTVVLQLAKRDRRVLARRHRLALAVAATVRDPAGTTRVVRKRVLVRAK